MQQLDSAFVQRILDCAPEGIAICDATQPALPVIYVNPAFEQLTGYAAAELLGANLRLLQGEDRDQEGIRRLREAVARGEACRVMVRNYRRSGELLWNEVALQPLRDAAGALTHFVAFYRDASGRLRQPEKTPDSLPGQLREDRVTGLCSRAWFDELLLREWRAARRDERPLTLALFDMDALASYNATFGRPAGDACLRRIARGIAAVFRRGADVVGAWRGGCIAVLAVHRDGEGVPGVIRHATATVQRVAEMHIHHPRAPLQKFVTVTAGLATVTPTRAEEQPERLVERAEAALREAREGMRGALQVAPD
ncbi:MAG TPA: diguanylate cyclase [Steroidobacteraceae bacterium]|nr:diguanylate cyclase [Steroidobacteraceae bacterium]